VSLRTRIDRLAESFHVKRIVPDCVVIDDDGIIVQLLPSTRNEWLGRHVRELPDHPAQYCKVYAGIDLDVILGLKPALFPTNQTED
jgi:hypothetical protein